MVMGTVTPGLSPVVLVHEQMQQRTRRQEQERQNAKEVRAMFGKQEEGGHRQKSQYSYNPFPIPTDSFTMLSMHAFTLSLLFQAGVVHPNEVGGKNQCEDQRVDGAQHHASGIYPCESGQRLKDRVVELDAAGAAQGQKPAQQADDVGDFGADYALPPVFHQ
jgi:hypothetical protein